MRRTDWWLLEAGGGRWVKLVKGDKKVNFKKQLAIKNNQVNIHIKFTVKVVFLANF